ncbi:NUDIX hydrolase [Rhodobacterales bacterium 52_120_T64]|nr:NUDIX hydrolase [Rhodobacterales bacterium 52_120_T64]
MRRFGTPPVHGISYTNRPGAYGIIRRGRDLLITYQSAPFNEFQLPGGGIDPGENATTALHREAFEETGWTITIDRKLGAFSFFTYMPEYDLYARKVCHIFECRAVIQKSEPLEPGHTALWMSPETAVTQIYSPGDRAFVRALCL